MPVCSRTPSTRWPGRGRWPTRGSSRVCSRTSTAASPTSRWKGHNIIFAVICLKALRGAPEAATPERIDGLRKMVRSFGKTRGGAVQDSYLLVGLDDEQKFVHFIFEEFLRAKGDGFDGHVVTIGHALVELSRIGRKDLARKGVPAYWQRVREACAGDDGGGANVCLRRVGRRPRSPVSTGPLRRSTASARSSAATRSSTRTASTLWPRT